MAPSRNAGPSDLILFEKWMDFCKWLLQRTARWPKLLRHTLTERVEKLALEILEDITTAACSSVQPATRCGLQLGAACNSVRPTTSPPPAAASPGPPRR